MLYMRRVPPIMAGLGGRRAGVYEAEEEVLQLRAIVEQSLHAAGARLVVEGAVRLDLFAPPRQGLQRTAPQTRWSIRWVGPTSTSPPRDQAQPQGW